jgi:hypothetical protein
VKSPGAASQQGSGDWEHCMLPDLMLSVDNESINAAGQEWNGKRSVQFHYLSLIV